jgi:hypothetical protein
VSDEIIFDDVSDERVDVQLEGAGAITIPTGDGSTATLAQELEAAHDPAFYASKRHIELAVERREYAKVPRRAAWELFGGFNYREGLARWCEERGLGYVHLGPHGVFVAKREDLPDFTAMEFEEAHETRLRMTKLP